MLPCADQRRPRQHRRRRHHHHHRMPTFGKHRSSITGSPLHSTLARFATAHGLRRGHTLEQCVSPAGLHPAAPSIARHLRRLYEELTKTGLPESATPREGQKKGGRLSRARLETFVQDVQQEDARRPSWWSFSRREEEDGFTFEQFQQLWWDEYSAAKRPIRPEDKDLDQPISNYLISSSHNTYIEDGNQITGEAKALQYKKVLESGCRCVEIDVWNGTEADDGTEDSALEKARSVKKKEKRHWSFSSMLSWMKKTCHATRSMSFPKSLRSKKSEASFRARPPQRAKPILEMMDSESTIASMLAREPRVCHAYETRGGDVTLHEPIPFRTVCRTIRESAFSHGNDLPVIISLEVHTNGPQQEKMVQIMKDEWGNLLLDEPLPDCHPHTTQPTPRDLRRKILIKVKTGTQAAHPATPKLGLDSGSTLQGSEPSDCGSSHCGTLKTKYTATGDAYCRRKEQRRTQTHNNNNKKLTIDALRRLAVYTYSPGPFTTFTRAEDAARPAHIYSFGEERLKALHRTDHRALFRHNRGFLARTFPESLSSFLSSNPNYPTLFWRKGVQMVALNWQVWDTAMELNDAMFDHEQGWVLKPPGYRSSSSSSSGSDSGSGGAGADCQADVAGKKRVDLTITVLAGQHIPTQHHHHHHSTEGDEARGGTTRVDVFAVNAEDFRPRVTCFLHVESAAERDPRRSMSSRDDTLVRRTRTARTEQPDWGSSGSRLHFSAVRHVVEKLSFVRFHVDHCRRGWPDRTAWACIRLDRLQEGYRLIKLKTDDGYRSDGVLLVKIQKTLVDEPRSVKARTWNVCKDGASQLKSRWSCI